MRLQGRIVEQGSGRGIAGAMVSVAPAKVSDTRYTPDSYGAKFAASTQTSPQGDFELCFDLEERAAVNVDLVVTAPQLLFDPKSDPTGSDDRVLQVLRMPMGPGDAMGLTIPVPEDRVEKVGLRQEGFARISTDMMRRGLLQTELANRSLAKEIRPRFKAKLAHRLAARDRLSGLSAAPASLRGSGLMVGDQSDTRAHEKAAVLSRKRLEDYAQAPQAKARLWLTPEELRRRLHLGASDPGEGPIAVTGSICDLVSPDKGPELQRIRSLLDEIPIPDPAHGEESGGDRDEDASEGGTEPLDASVLVDRAIRQRVEALTAASEKPSPIDGLRRLSESVESFQLPVGPTDDVAYHDFYSLQIAFEDVWAEAFDGGLREAAEELYGLVVELHEEYDLETSWLGEIDDIEALRTFIDETDRRRKSVPLGERPRAVQAAFPGVSMLEWNRLSCAQQASIRLAAEALGRARTEEQRARIHEEVRAIVAAPEGRLLRVEKLIVGLRARMSEPYGFHYFAPDSVNYGILLTYRQRWAPEAYQVGRLVSTIPLAPSESRRIQVEQKVALTRAEQERRSSLRAFRDDSREGRRAEAEIVRRARTATNFQQTVQGSLNFGLGQVGATSVFGVNQANESARTKRAFRQSVRAASQEFRDQRQLEVKTSTASEEVTERTHQISNPNDEITVTYLLYELERRYRVSESLHRLTPVVMVAQDIPHPHEIDDAWLIAHEWVLRRVLLDDAFDKALDLLTKGFASDEAGVGIARQAWELQRTVVDELKGRHSAASEARTALQQRLVDTMLGQAEVAASEPDATQIAAAAIATGGWSLLFGEGDSGSERFEAMRKALEARLEQLEETVSRLRSELRAASDALDKAQVAYTTALREQMDRRTLVDQLRVHVKENILHYMQAIWDHEPPDQRFFRLYHVEVPVPGPGPGGCRLRRATAEDAAGENVVRRDGHLWVLECAAPSFEDVEKRPLGKIADLDRPLGFKGNYIIFALKECVYLTDFMMQEYVDDYLGIRDPDRLGAFSTEELVELRRAVGAEMPPEDRSLLDRILASRLTGPSGEEERIVVPTGELMLELLPGTQPAMEQFKRIHRAMDVIKVENEIRMDELEALRYSARLLAGDLHDPDVDRHIVVEDADVMVTTEG